MKRLLIIALLLSGSAFGATHYVWCAAAGAATGNDFTNATLDLPTNLVRGDTYVIAGSVSCSYGRHIFQDAVSGTSIITTRHAISGDSGVAGYQAAFTSAVAKWTVSAGVAPIPGGTELWRVCTDYYNFDGITGDIGSPAVNASGFGFLLTALNNVGGINVSQNSCGDASLHVNHVNFKHIEYDGQQAYRQVSVTACTWDGTNATVTTATPDWNAAWGQSWFVGLEIDGFTAGAGIVFRGDVAPNPKIASQSGNQFVTQNVSSNPCATLDSVAFTQTGTRAVKIGGVAGGSSFDVNFDTLWLHRTGNSTFLFGNYSSSTINKVRFEENRSTPSQHSNAWNQSGSSVGTGFSVTANLTITNFLMTNIQGTSYIVSLNATTCGSQPAGTATNCVYDGPWNFSGGQLWNPGPGGTSALIDCINGNTCLINFNNNTAYGITSGNTQCINKCGNNGIQSVIKVQNNYFENNAMHAPAIDAGTGSNTPCYDDTAGCASTAVIVMDHNYYFNNTTGSGSLPAEVHGQFAVSSLLTSATNFALTGATSSGATIAFTDPLGVGAPQAGIYNRGAFQFAAVAASYTVTASCAGNSNGTIIGSAGSAMNATCTAGVCSGTCSESVTAGATVTYTATATTGSLASFTGGICNGSPCSPTINAPLTITATFQLTPTCTFTCVSNNINSPATISCTAALTGLSSNYLWELTEPINGNVIAACNTDGCKTGATGNLQYTGSGIYTLSAIANGVFCTASTQPLNINTGAGSAAH